MAGLKLSGPVQLAVVSDDVSTIQGKLLEWCDGPNPSHLIFTTGGTGFGVCVGVFVGYSNFLLLAWIVGFDCVVAGA